MVARQEIGALINKKVTVMMGKNDKTRNINKLLKDYQTVPLQKLNTNLNEFPTKSSVEKVTISSVEVEPLSASNLSSSQDSNSNSSYNIHAKKFIGEDTHSGLNEEDVG